MREGHMGSRARVLAAIALCVALVIGTGGAASAWVAEYPQPPSFLDISKVRQIAMLVKNFGPADTFTCTVSYRGANWRTAKTTFNAGYIKHYESRRYVHIDVVGWRLSTSGVYPVFVWAKCLPS